MMLYRSHDRKQALQYRPWHIVNPETLLAFCGDDPHDCGQHFYGIDGELPEGDRFCKARFHAMHGYKVENVRYGQVRRYGPTVNGWHITDLTGQRAPEEIKAYCREHVRPAPARGEDGYHTLHEHYQGFKAVYGQEHTYYYQTGRDWTG